VVAALRRSEALGQVPSEAPSRTPVSTVATRSPEQVPRLFAQGYAGYRESCRPAEEGAAAPGPAPAEEAAARPLQQLRLRVRPWHRVALLKMLCRALLYHFLQDRRRALGLQAGQPPLWGWELRAAQEHSAAGKLEALVKYLAETELHMQLGPERSAQLPGSFLPERTAQRLRAERRRLARSWGLAANELEEDAVVRVFLDGQLSWPAARAQLGAAADAAGLQAPSGPP